MWKTIVPAAAVLAAEAVIRRRINALPAETFPLRVGPRVQLRRAHNRGLLCSKLAQKPRAVIPFFRRIIWNAADLSVLTGCITAVIALLCDEF